METAVCGYTTGTCPYNHLRINFVPFDRTYSRRQTNAAVRKLGWWTYVPAWSWVSAFTLQTFTLFRLLFPLFQNLKHCVNKHVILIAWDGKGDGDGDKDRWCENACWYCEDNVGIGTNYCPHAGLKFTSLCKTTPSLQHVVPVSQQ